MLAVSDTLLLLSELRCDKNVDVCTLFGAAAAAGEVLVVTRVWKDLCSGPSPFLGDLALAFLVFAALPASAATSRQ